jgi:hypothetical protein
MESGKSQCIEKFFAWAAPPRGGGGAKIKIQKSKIAKLQNRKIENRTFWLLPKKTKKLKIQGIASLFDGYRRSKRRLSAWSLFNTALDRIILALRYTLRSDEFFFF